MKKLFFLLSAFYCYNFLAAQNPEKPKLITGPVLGAITQTSVRVWIAYRGDGQNLLTLVDSADGTLHTPTGFNKIHDSKGIAALTMDFTNLLPNHTYKVEFIRDAGLAPKCTFTTLADTAVKDFDFLAGSCTLMNTDFSRFMFPGGSVYIFESMRRKKGDFMLWLGDNVYYLGKHHSSYDAMFNRNLKVRNLFPLLQTFLAQQPNYAIWDDHDYGWNDADKNFPLKDTALKVFKGFWANPYNDSLQGNYFSFRHYDAEFFMTDDRFFRDPEGDTSGAFLGEQQIAWLKNKLSASDASFKFICVGSQVLNDSYYGESYAKYSKERNGLLDYIAEQNIKGVIFITGDKHYSEMSKREWKGYTFFDFTTSPLTSPIVKIRTPGFINKYTVPGTLLYRKNFAKISISGEAGNRVCKMEVFNRIGDKKWEYVVNSNDLQKK